MAGEGIVYFSVLDGNEATTGHGGGVLYEGANLFSCTIVGNSSAQDGSGVYYGCAGVPEMWTTIIAFGEGGAGVGAAEGSDPGLHCCDVYGNAGGNYDSVVGDQTGIDDNFSEDPQFCDMGQRDYLLFNTSPCASWNSPCGQTVGRYWVGCTSPVAETSWGSLKALWR